MIRVISISPEEYKHIIGFRILYGTYDSPFEKVLIGVTAAENAVCHLWFLDDDFEDVFKVMKKDWINANLVQDQKKIQEVAKVVFGGNEDVWVFLKGTEFQVKVWKALLEIPKGSTMVYSELAGVVGKPKAVRATAKVVAGNRIAYLVPCHRVVSKAGGNKYKWGVERKLEILEYERRKVHGVFCT